MSTRHYVSETCKQVEERQIRRNTLHHCFNSGRVLFHINTEALPPSEAFPYLGRTIDYNNSGCPAVYQNLKKEQMWWGVTTRVLVKMGATVWACGMI